jgi:hypothetical protein
MAEQQPPGERFPLLFVRHGEKPDPAWLAAHPGWVKFPATFVPRSSRAGTNPASSARAPAPDAPRPPSTPTRRCDSTGRTGFLNLPPVVNMTGVGSQTGPDLAAAVRAYQRMSRLTSAGTMATSAPAQAPPQLNQDDPANPRRLAGLADGVGRNIDTNNRQLSASNQPPRSDQTQAARSVSLPVQPPSRRANLDQHPALAGSTSTPQAVTSPDNDNVQLIATPNRGQPNSWYTNQGSGQMRLYGPDGNPALDIDSDHDHPGVGSLHMHVWVPVPGEFPVRQAPVPLPDGF